VTINRDRTGARDDAARDGAGGGGNGVPSGLVAPPETPEQRDARRAEVQRRRDEMTRRARLAREELAAADYPALADAVRDNARILAEHSATLEALHMLMRETVETAGLAEPKPRTRHLKVVRDDEAS
jgi:hypothetical protein